MGAAQIPVAWTISKGTLPIIGVTKRHHISDAVAAASISFSQEEVAELESLADSLSIDPVIDGAVGVKVTTSNNGVYLGDSSLDPFFEALDARGAMVIMHPCRAKESPRDCITGGVAAIYEYPTDTTRAVLNMIANRTMSRFPNIRVSVNY